MTLLSQQQLIGEVARYAGPAKLNVLPPLCPLKVSAADFSHADQLIDRAKKVTGSWLDEGGTDLPKPERFLSMHEHNPDEEPLPAPTGSDLSFGSAVSVAEPGIALPPRAARLRLGIQPGIHGPGLGGVRTHPTHDDRSE